MANPITISDLPGLPRIGPSSFQNGDLFFCNGSDEISRAIQSVTGSIWSHIGIIFYVTEVNDWYVLQSTDATGVGMVPVSSYLTDNDGTGKGYSGNILIARVAGLSPDQAAEVVAFCLFKFGKPYNKLEDAEILAKIILRIGTVQQNGEQYICSELVWDAFNEAGITLNQDAGGFVDPGNEWLDHKVQPVGVLLAYQGTP